MPLLIATTCTEVFGSWRLEGSLGHALEALQASLGNDQDQQHRRRCSSGNQEPTAPSQSPPQPFGTHLARDTLTGLLG